MADALQNKQKGLKNLKFAFYFSSAGLINTWLLVLINDLGRIGALDRAHLFVEIVSLFLKITAIAYYIAGLGIGVFACIQFASPRGNIKYLILAIIMGLLWWIAVPISIPQFLEFAAEAKQWEAKHVLRELSDAQKDYHSRFGKYATTFDQLGYQIRGTPRYRIFLSATEMTNIGEERNYCQNYDRGCAKLIGLTPFVKNDSFLIIAVSNIDAEALFDVWVIDEKHGRPLNIINDVKYSTWPEAQKGKLRAEFYRGIFRKMALN